MCANHPLVITPLAPPARRAAMAPPHRRAYRRRASERGTRHAVSDQRGGPWWPTCRDGRGSYSDPGRVCTREKSGLVPVRLLYIATQWFAVSITACTAIYSRYLSSTSFSSGRVLAASLTELYPRAAALEPERARAACLWRVGRRRPAPHRIMLCISPAESYSTRRVIECKYEM